MAIFAVKTLLRFLTAGRLAQQVITRGTAAALAVRLAWPIARTLGWGLNALSARGIPTGIPAALSQLFPRSRALRQIATLFRILPGGFPFGLGLSLPGGEAFLRGIAYENEQDMAQEWLNWWGEAFTPGLELHETVFGDLDDPESLVSFALARWIDEGLDADDIIAFLRGIEGQLDDIARLAQFGAPEFEIIPPPQTAIRDFAAFVVGLAWGTISTLVGLPPREAEDRGLSLSEQEKLRRDLFNEIFKRGFDFRLATEGDEAAQRRLVRQARGLLPGLARFLKELTPQNVSQKVADKLLALVRRVG